MYRNLSIIVKFLLLFSLYPLQAGASASNEFLINIRQINNSEGLSHRRVHCLHQDQRGMMWIGTDKGLNRYDGHEFRHWTKSKNGLTALAIHRIFEDHEGLLWLINQTKYEAHVLNGVKHIDILNPVTGMHQSIDEYFGDQLPFDWHKLTNIFVTHNNHFLLVSSEGYWEYLPKLGFQKVDLPLSVEPKAYQYPRTLLAKVDGRIKSFDLSTGKQKIFSESIDEISRTVNIKAEESILICYLPEQKWVDGQLIHHNAQRRQFKRLELPESYKYWHRSFVAFDQDREYTWMAKGRSFSVYNSQHELMYTFNNKDFDKVLERDVKCFLIDHNGVAWIGTDNGVYLIDFKKNYFRSYLYNSLDSIDHKDLISCRNLLERGDFLYANTYKGKKKINLQTGEVVTLKRFSKNFKSPPRPFSLAPARSGKLWMGAFQLIEHDPVSDRETAISIISDKNNRRNRIWSIYEDEDRRVWVGTREGLCYLSAHNIDQQKAQPYTQYNDFGELAQSFILQILPIDTQELLLATNTGLYLLNKSTGVQARYWLGGKGAFYLPAEKIQHIYKDKAGIYWLATDGAGLIRWDRAKGEWQQFGQEQGLSNDNIYAVYEDDHDALWLSSDYGINRFHKKTHTVHIFLQEDGISHYEFNRTSHYQSPTTGRIYFGGLNGITSFDPADFVHLNEGQTKQEIQLTAFTKRAWRDREVTDAWMEAVQNERLQLKHDEGELQFKFSLRDYFYNDRVRYFYKIIPRDDQWIALKGNELLFHNPIPGEYTLLVKARAADGQFVAHQFMLPIVIDKPFTRTFWFFGLLLGLAALIIWRSHEWRLSRLRKQQQKLESEVSKRTAKIVQQAEELKKDKYTIEQQAKELKDLDKAKSRFFANISHELRTPLSLILGPINRVLRRNRLESEDRRLLQLMSQNSDQLMQRIEELLDLSRMEAEQLPLKESPQLIYSLLREQVANFKSFALQRKVRLSLDFKAAPELRILLDEVKFKKIISNLLSNALKFTPPEGEVRVQLSDLGSQLRICIEDNGTGIHPEDLPHIFGRFYQARHNAAGMGGTGIGLSLSREMAHIMNGEITVNSTYGKGSRFCFEFPKVEIIVDIEESPRLEPELVTAGLSIEPLPTTKNGLATILLVEDNYALREYLGTELKDYTLLMAANGQEALDILMASQPQATSVATTDWGGGAVTQDPVLPDLILSDIMMPVMDGFELLRQLKENKVWQAIPVVMLTARSDQSDKLTALRIGVDDYLVKPFDTNELMVRINNLLERSQLRQPIAEVEDEGPKIGKETQEWLKKVEATVLEQLAHSDFTLEKLAADLFISKRQLQRRLKAATGLTAHNYLREIKLHQARQLIEQGRCDTLAELSYAVGFTDPHYFSTLYQKRFGCKPMS